jgi:hypothetical protein
MKRALKSLLRSLLSEDGYLLLTEFSRTRHEVKLRVQDFFIEDMDEWLTLFVEGLAQSVRDDIGEERERDEDDEDGYDIDDVDDYDGGDLVERLLTRAVVAAAGVKPQIPRMPIKPPESTAKTRAFLAELKIGDRVLLATGISEVLELPTSINGWELVKVTPMRPPRPNSEDATFYMVPLSQVQCIVGAGGGAPGGDRGVTGGSSIGGLGGGGGVDNA